MTLKERLDAVWNNYGCLLPNNFITWSENYGGYTTVIKHGLFYKKGKKFYSKRHRLSGKARWLFKNYGAYSQMRSKQ